MREAEIARLLPEIYQAAIRQGSVLDGALGAMAGLHGSLERAIADPAAFVDPRRAGDALLPIIARWLGLDLYLDRRTELAAGRQGRVAPDSGNLRELAAAAADLGRRRGTADALVSFLERATGCRGFSVTDAVPDGAGRIIPFHMQVGVPPAAAGQIDLVELVLHGEKPAFTTFEIVVASDDGRSPENEHAKLPDRRRDDAPDPDPG